MAFARPQQVRHVDENADHVKESKGAAGMGRALQPSDNNRRALGDIGNLFNNNLHVGKGQAGAKKAAALVEKPQAKRPTGGVLTRRAAAAAEAAGLAALEKAPEAVPAGKPRPAPRAEPAAAEQARKPPVAVQAASTSAILQKRSEDAVAVRNPAPPPAPEVDVDELDKSNPRAATEYVNDIFDYFRRVEPHYRVSPSYMSRQTDINDRMRAILLDWLVEVHFKFKLLPETLYLTANIIDRFLEKKLVMRKKLQLVGVTAMLIASKYEDIWAPEVRDFVYISDQAYTAEQILEMEKIMLNSLRFSLTVPTALNFLNRYCKVGLQAAEGQEQEMKQAVHFATYLVELSLVDYSCLKFSYSQVAAAAVFCTRLMLQMEPVMPQGMWKHSGFTEEALRPAALAMAALHRKAPTSNLISVHKKYGAPRFLSVSKIAGLHDRLQERINAQ
ncbi:hypothetical protein WJX73_008530 [Symbiochloris irregularis]|uniref:Cyclin N-terminal domain-containing protein n=1 Tax=Symbiochloris irregularis TaxID=706552 RepID=A0AAW1Q037_9CHLO